MAAPVAHPTPDKLLLRIGHRVRTLRLKRGWTQVEAAEKIGLDRSFLADVERGRRNISVRNLYLVAKGFKKTLAQLLSGI
jgi:transcriptional regulator with XRE-family HTH domain